MVKTLDSETSKTYQVEHIIGKKYINKKKYYLVKWENYTESESTWEPYYNLKNVKDFI